MRDEIREMDTNETQMRHKGDTNDKSLLRRVHRDPQNGIHDSRKIFLRLWSCFLSIIAVVRLFSPIFSMSSLVIYNNHEPK